MPDAQPNMNALWDLRDADVSSFSSPAVERLAEFVSTQWGTGGKSRAALVVLQDLAFGLSRMYEILLGGRTSSDVQVFRDYAEALEWVTTSD
ncbi:MAG: hypothetical protein JSW58_09920 [Candidatus Latescibacterota bacterium]|nr:MAG: hypothetical protein JSW58_09920 [Candidatus Latescibacterota bacterium]